MGQRNRIMPLKEIEHDEKERFSIKKKRVLLLAKRDKI